MNNLNPVTEAPLLHARGIAPIVLAGIIAGASAIAAGGLSIAGANKQARIAKRTSMDLARYNSQLNEEMYLKYQSPSAQMAQYRAAGLNPNLIYGQSLSGPSAGQADYSDEMAPNKGALAAQSLMSAVQMYQNIQLNDAKVTQAAAAAKALETKAALDDAKTTAQNIANDFAQARNTYTLEGLSKDNAMKAIDLEIKQQYAAHEAKAKLDKLLADTDLSRAEKKRVEKTIEKYDQEIKESQARVTNMQQQIALGFGELNLAREQFHEGQLMNKHKRKVDYFTMKLNNRKFNIEAAKTAQNMQLAIANQVLESQRLVWDKYNKDAGRIRINVPFIGR